MMAQKGIYVGAGTDSAFLQTDFETMVCVDSMPGGHYGLMIEDPNPLLEEDPALGISPCRYRWFIKELIENYRRDGFNLKKHSPDEKLLIFQNEDQTKTVNYHYNISFPEEFKEDQTFDLLYIAGFYPDQQIIKMMKEQFQIYGSSSTHYDFSLVSETGENTLFYLKEVLDNITQWSLIEYEWNKILNNYEYVEETIHPDLSSFLAQHHIIWSRSDD